MNTRIQIILNFELTAWEYLYLVWAADAWNGFIGKTSKYNIMYST
jgi:hypothetical protein